MAMAKAERYRALLQSNWVKRLLSRNQEDMKEEEEEEEKAEKNLCSSSPSSAVKTYFCKDFRSCWSLGSKSQFREQDKVAQVATKKGKKNVKKIHSSRRRYKFPMRKSNSSNGALVANESVSSACSSSNAVVLFHSPLLIKEVPSFVKEKANLCATKQDSGNLLRLCNASSKELTKKSNSGSHKVQVQMQTSISAAK